MQPYSSIERQARENGHAPSFDRHHFHQDGGNKLFSGSIVQNPSKVDEELWEKAKKASKEEAFGKNCCQKQSGAFG